MSKLLISTMIISMLLSAKVLHAQLIEYALEDKGTMDYVLQNGTITLVTSPVRAGNFAFRHQASTSQKRAEIDDRSWHAYDAKGNVFWYGMSYYLPAASFSDNINTYITQFRFSNIPEGSSTVQNCTTRACNQGGGESGSGHHMKVNNSLWEFTLRHQDPDCALCKGSITRKFFFGNITLDKWTDFIFQARWSHNTDGFLKVWKQIDDGGYELVLDYQGRTWYDKYADGSHRQGQDVKAPNFTIGLYYSNKTDLRTLYTDEIRIYQQEPHVDGFSVVRPDQYNIECTEEAAPQTPTGFSGFATATKQITLSWNAVDDNEDGYFLERKTEGKEFNLLVQLEKGASTFVDNGLEDDNTYMYRIASYNCFGSSLYSEEVEVFLEKDHTQVLEIVSVSASNHLGNYKPENAIDGVLTTYWLIEGENEWLQLELKDVAKISRVNIGFIHGNSRKYEFALEASPDGIEWTKMGSYISSGTISGFEEYEIDETDTKYVRYITGKNSIDTRTWLAEIQIRGKLATSTDNLFANNDIFQIRQMPTCNSLEITIHDDYFNHATLLAYNMSGQLVGAEKITDSLHIFQTSDFAPGVYLIKLQGINRNAIQKVWFR